MVHVANMSSQLFTVMFLMIPPVILEPASWHCIVHEWYCTRLLSMLLGRNTGRQTASVRRHERNSLDPRKGDFLKLMMRASRFVLERACSAVCPSVLSLSNGSTRHSCVAAVCDSFIGSYFEVMNGHDVENYSWGGKDSKYNTEWNCQVVCAFSIVSNPILRKTQNLEEENWCGTHSETLGGDFCLFSEPGSVPYWVKL
jgi:hypothetical protein